MGEKGLRGTEAIEKLPPGYKIVPTAQGGATAKLDSVRPSLPIVWDSEHGVWMPPGYVHDPSDPSRLFNQTSGGNAVWDDKDQRWVDAKSGSPLSYEQ